MTAPPYIDFARQTRYRDALRQAAEWIGSALATTDAQTATNCGVRAMGYVLAMTENAQLPAEYSVAEAMADVVVATAPK